MARASMEMFEATSWASRADMFEVTSLGDTASRQIAVRVRPTPTGVFDERGMVSAELLRDVDRSIQRLQRSQREQRFHRRLNVLFIAVWAFIILISRIPDLLAWWLSR